MATDTLSTVFSALADPTRRSILEQLTHGPLAMGEIAKKFSISGPAITKHLKVLERAGLIRADKQAQLRPRTLDATRLKEAQEYIESYRKFWDESFDRLDQFLIELQAQEKKNNP
ncbi:MAG: metalloregulator ArsR/SmtB family transcription factor [Armatimonadetes bacterium]|nr:metalloregulator ArsR/SmtB family transcription factor [Armatimonadota bacterium]MBS1728084.1 winged helix-turn-helix transcriptional regulator [Armatimonadota bacterium]